MADYKLIGHNYQTPDIVAKVTGQAKYAGEHQAHDLAYGVVVSSGIAKGKITRIDAVKALALKGVLAVMQERPAGEASSAKLPASKPRRRADAG